MHSSGSTSFPKPIYGTAKIWMQWGTLFHWGDVDVCGSRISTHVIPMFHGMGTIMLAVGACAGLVLAMFKPANPPAIPTPESGQPLSYDPKNIPTLRDLKIFIYAAAPLNEDVADKLIDTEIILTRNPRVKAALMFGRGKLQNGVLIQPEEDYEFDPADVTKLEKFRNAIWPDVEKANEFAPSHSRLFKEMIITTHPDKPFLWTAKGTPRGKVSLVQYDKEIEALYDTVADASQTDIEPPVKWTPDLTIEFVRTVAGCDRYHPYLFLKIGADGGTVSK
ncbi:hypothetical protein EWM64_g3219 [Hericium alpestre]|uniref:AMP-dependent synthetase/ligase domain-containing protein n=1 Tax=Hericium alpestre TaxID=135208 RepID=A0A4Z0A264_9AGAM|nr:hypothetical protein EWM64_g3219 [Hericium alpestre]